MLTWHQQLEMSLDRKKRILTLTHVYSHIHPYTFVSYCWLDLELRGELMTDLTILCGRMHLFKPLMLVYC